MAWRSICTRYLSRRRELVPADQGGVVAEDLAAAVDFPEAGSAVVVAERSNFAARMVRPERLELPTLCSEGRCSIQLSYGRIPKHSTQFQPRAHGVQPPAE